ncbi:hypothetical protein [Robiginitalea aurantiaca]|uniref:Uncharacterized protein n=1 Tax=Robiginitalea aurantiaca TaxID=3056915 RepID=A0ABT7WC41_9FLAO|nr:hypothetical protein [Robiginitalea aurantiaca]MDM9630481.1 hypothetical protein [Robiginitalea aurantiaca]
MENKRYNIEDLLSETITDMENLVSDLDSEVTDDLEEALEEASNELKRSLHKLVKSVKKEVRTDVLSFYHDNKKLINSDLKSLNSFVREILADIKSELSEGIHDAEDKDDKKELREIRKDVVRFTRRYNHAYHKLRLKLALGNAGVSVQEFFNHKS